MEFSILTAVFFGALAIIFSIKEERSKKKLAEAQKQLEAEKNKLKDNIINEENMNKVKEELTHVMVHELRAPLASIKDSSELLLSDKFTEEEKKQFLKIINHEAKLLLSHVSGILDAAKLESGTFTLEKNKENISDIIYETIKLFEPQANKKNLTLSSHIDSPFPFVFIDKIRIEQVINNLLSNSIKFTPQGGKITVKARRSLDGGVEIIVEDTGIGVPKELQGDIFNKFYQVKNHGIEIQGTGLGLYITKKIVEAHGGTIEIESEENQGTKIKVSLPAYDETHQAPSYLTN